MDDLRVSTLLSSIKLLKANNVAPPYYTLAVSDKGKAVIVIYTDFEGNIVPEHIWGIMDLDA
jgi:hypothetical protein